MGSTDLKHKFSSILKENHIDDEIARVTISKPDLKGQHMASVIETATIDFENTGENKPPMELFLKKRLPPCGVPLMDDGMKRVMMREGQFLKEFTDQLSQLSLERSNGSVNLTSELFPKTLFYDEDVIVMENLIYQGYSILPKHARQDFKDASTVVCHLAKLHAVSFVAIENAGGSKLFLESNPNFEEKMSQKESQEMMSQAFEPGFGIALEVLKKSTNEEADDKYEILSKYKGKLVENMVRSVEVENLFECVLHGDCWNNNMMFNETREKVVLVDFQFTRVGSPSLDLCYFLFTSTKSDVRKRWKELLQVYFDSLKSNVESLKQPFEYIFEDFVDDFIRKSKLGFFFGFFLILGMEAMGGHDTSADSGDLCSVFTNMVSKWVDEFPDKAQAASLSMISMVNDYLLFGQL